MSQKIFMVRPKLSSSLILLLCGFILGAWAFYHIFIKPSALSINHLPALTGVGALIAYSIFAFFGLVAFIGGIGSVIRHFQGYKTIIFNEHNITLPKFKIMKTEDYQLNYSQIHQFNIKQRGKNATLYLKTEYGKFDFPSEMFESLTHFTDFLQEIVNKMQLRQP